jgi:hypothetical protein
VSTPAKTRTITLTGRAPVRVREDLWPVIASGRSWSGEHWSEANYVWHLTVRKHADGRTIVYGSEDEGNGGVPRDYVSAHAGELLEAGADVAGAILRVASGARCPPGMAQACIADLPAEDLV